MNKETKKDFWNELNDFQKKDIEAGLEDLSKGKKKDFNKVIAKYNSKKKN